MSISLNPETERLIEERLRTTGIESADDLVRMALQSFDESGVGEFDSLDADTRAAIDEAEAQFERGEGRRWEEVREELRARFIR